VGETEQAIATWRTARDEVPRAQCVDAQVAQDAGAYQQRFGYAMPAPIHCGDVFEPTRPHQKFCRPSCRRAAFTGRRKQPRLPVGDPEDLFRVPFE
jgi:hypothetical protein